VGATLARAAKEHRSPRANTRALLAGGDRQAPHHRPVPAQLLAFLHPATLEHAATLEDVFVLYNARRRKSMSPIPRR
jgi:hypothetical protein